MNEVTTAALAPADSNSNVTDLLRARAQATPTGVLFSLPNGGSWTPVTSRDFEAQVSAVAKGLIAAGLSFGDRIGLMSKTRYEWTLIDFAVWYAGCVLVPIYETSAPAQVRWNLQDSDAVAVILETPDHFAAFDEIHPDVPNIAHTWQIDLGDLDKLITLGMKITDAELEERRAKAKGSDLATIIYTSGSTGTPKGCALTHSNFVELSRNTALAIPEVLSDGASTLLFITLAHVFARFISVLCVHAGIHVGHQPDTTRLLPAFSSFKPTFILAVPRVFEKIYNASELHAESTGKGNIFRSAAAAAVAYSKAREAGSIPIALRIKFAALDRLVLSRLRAAMGGCVRYAVSGSAPLGAQLAHFYSALGLQILEGYGLTETTAPTNVNLPSKTKIGTVGPPLPGVSIRLAGDGEVEVKGVNVFDGYWKNPASTSETFDGKWLKTGDVGLIDDDGYLTIIGRKKELIVTAGGKNVAPAALEDPIRSHPLVSQVVVVGDRRPYVAALITLDHEMLPLWLANHGERTDMPLDEAAVHPKVFTEIQNAVNAANSAVSRAESIREFKILPDIFSEASGHLTPKLSIKRHVIATDYAETIDEMYRHPNSNSRPSQ